MTKTCHKTTDRAGRVGSEAENQRANIKNYENYRNSGTMQRPKGPKRFLSALTVCHQPEHRGPLDGGHVQSEK